MPGQHELCQPFLDRHRTDRGWDIYHARDDLMAETPLDEIGRAFGPIGVLQYMRQMTCKGGKGSKGKGAKPEADQFSFAFSYFGVDPGHIVGDADVEETIKTDAMTLEEFNQVISRCDEQIFVDIEANKRRKAMRDELRPIFKANPKIKTIGDAIKERVRQPEPA
jgi:hypothetical protein